MERLLLSLFMALLAGCAGLAPPSSPTAALFADASFQAPSETVGSQDLFDLSPEMRAHLRSPAFAARLRERGPKQGLVDALYSKGELQLEYDSRVTRSAAGTYAARSGNCLSLVIMTAAFARELGLKVRFQSVNTDEMWSRDGGLYMVATHVNIALGRRDAPGNYSSDAQSMLVVDFVPPPKDARMRTRELDETDIEILFLNNRAVETMVAGRIDDAYWWARSAVAQSPRDATAYNTLGVIYQRHGDQAMAERAFRAALEREPENLPVLQNLGPMLAAQGRTEEAQALARRAAAIQPTPPYHYFDQGMTALRQGDYDAARRLFEREVQRAPYSDEFHFWLAIAYLQLGEPGQAREQLALAVQHSARGDMRELYSTKLAHLRRQSANSIKIQ